MKKTILSICILNFLFSTCKKDEKVTCNESYTKDNIGDTSSRMLLLQVDYLTFNFEQGVEEVFSPSTIRTDSLPVNLVFSPTWDFARLTMTHSITRDTIFDGPVTWSGGPYGKCNYPTNWKAAESFRKICSSSFSDITPEIVKGGFVTKDIPIKKIWNSVYHLDLVNQYMANGAKAGVFFYPPTVGTGNPSDWKWYVVLFR